MVLVIPPCLSKHKCVSLGSWCLSRSSLYISSWAWQAHFWNWFNRPPSNCFHVAVVWLWNGSVQINIFLSVPPKAIKQARARTLDWEPSKWVHIPWHSHTHCTLTHCCCFCLLFSCTVVSSHSPSLSIQSHSVHTHTHPSLPFLSDGSFKWQHPYPVFREDWIKWMNEQIQSTID